MNRIEAAGRALREQPEIARTPLAELEQRVTRRKQRRVLRASAALFAVAVVAGGFWAASDDEGDAPVIADRPDDTTGLPFGFDALPGRGILLVEGDASEGLVVGLDGTSYGPVDVGEIVDGDADAQFFLREGGENTPMVVQRPRPDGGQNGECSSFVASIAGDTYGVCANDQEIARVDADGLNHVVVGLPSGEAEGRWQHLRVSPEGTWLSAEFVGACDAPSTYLFRPDSSEVHAVTGPSGASETIGWIDADTAAVSVFGRCNVAFDGPAGVHAVRPGEAPSVVVEADEPYRAYLWQRLDNAGSAATQEARARWVALGVHDYTFEYRPRCFCGLGPTRITVADDRVVATEPLTDTFAMPVSDAPIIKQLIDEVAAAERDATGAVDVLYDESGIPIAVSIDNIANAIDDEMAWTITNFTMS